MHDQHYERLRLNVSGTSFEPIVVTRLERADQFVRELNDNTRPRFLNFASKLAIHSLNRLQDDARVCLELTVTAPSMPWVKLHAVIPLDGDGSLFDQATASLRRVVKLLDQRGEP